MNRYSIPMFRLNGVGFTKRCRWAYSQPEMAAIKAGQHKQLDPITGSIHAHGLGHDASAL